MFVRVSFAFICVATSTVAHTTNIPVELVYYPDFALVDRRVVTADAGEDRTVAEVVAFHGNQIFAVGINNPHIFALVADRVFLPSGTLRVLPPLSATVLRKALRHRVLSNLCTEGVLVTGLAQRMLLWPYSSTALLTYLRSAFGNSALPVPEAEGGKVPVNDPRDAPWREGNLAYRIGLRH